MTSIKYILFFLILLSCKKQSSTDESSINITHHPENNKILEKTTPVIDYSRFQKLDCEVLFKEIILSSSIDINYDIIKKEKIAILFDEINSSNIKARVELKTDLNNMPLKWVNLNLKEGKLLDITDELEHPQLTYDIKIFKIYQEKCLNNNDNVVVKPVQYQDGYNTVELSKYKTNSNNTLNSIYSQLAKSKEFEGNGLLNSIPKKDTVFNVTKGGATLNNLYRIDKEKLDLEISYPGGITAIYLYKKNDSIFLKKIYSPD